MQFLLHTFLIPRDAVKRGVRSLLCKKLKEFNHDREFSFDVAAVDVTRNLILFLPHH